MKRSDLCNLAAAAFVLAAAVSAEDGAIGMTFPSKCPVRIEGTARGGRVTLSFPPGDSYPGLHTFTVTSAAGESVGDLYRKIIALYKKKTEGQRDAWQSKGTLYFRHYVRGEIGVRSTDPGISPIPSPMNVTAKPDKDKNVVVSWNVPPGIVYDAVYIVCNRMHFGVINNPSEVTSYTDYVGKDPIRTGGKLHATTLSYRIVAYIGDKPSGVVDINIPNPTPAE